jgi:hypothetical protein
MGSHHPFGCLKHELWPKEKSGIDLISLRAGDVKHIVENLLTRATTSLWILLQLEVYTKSYGPPKS